MCHVVERSVEYDDFIFVLKEKANGMTLPDMAGVAVCHYHDA
jgi:hypothetical protein